MGQKTEIFDVGRLGLSSGEGRRLELEVPVADFDFGGQRYEVPGGSVSAMLDVAHTTSGYSLRLRFDTALEGPCMRCLDEAGHPVAVDAREWTRDALALALPTQIVCSEDCLGLCPVCGENLNRAAAGHAHEPEPDPRWAALRELRLE